MKYVLVIAVLFGPVDGDWTEHQKTVFVDTYPNEAACYAAMDETMEELSSRENFRGAIMECKPEDDAEL